MKDEGGYTLLEILAAIVILGIILTVFFQLFVFSQKTTTDNREQLTALKIAESVLERMVNDEDMRTVYHVGSLSPADKVTLKDEDVPESDKYKVIIAIDKDDEGNFTALGVRYLIVEVYHKTDDKMDRPLSEVKGLIEL